MRETMNISYQLDLHSFGRDYEDNFGEADKADVAIWQDAITLLDRHTLKLVDSEVLLSFDWSGALERCKQHAEVNGKIKSEGEYEKYKELLNLFREPVRVNCNAITTLDTSKKVKEAFFNITESAIEMVLHEIFLLLNLSVPGSCSFYKVSIPSHFSAFQGKDNEVQLSSYIFEMAWLDSLQHGWPSISRLPLTHVIGWYRGLGIGTRQVAQNSMERCLFSLLHVCHNSSLNPDTLIWLAHAIESIFRTEPGQSQASLLRRAQCLLGASPKQAKVLKKGISNFYSLRSSFVHGGFKVIHPLSHDLVDKEVEQIISSIIEAQDFAVVILVAALQEMIKNNWKELRYTEQLQALTIDHN